MNGDLISRNALLSKMFPYGMPDNGNYGINARAVRDAVVAAKAVEAEPVVHAHWIIERWNSGWIKRCDCSNCGNHPKDAYNPPKYCDNCGAHMDEEVARE